MAAEGIYQRQNYILSLDYCYLAIDDRFMMRFFTNNKQEYMALLEVIHDYMRGNRHILDKTQDMKEWENVNFHLKYCDYFYDLFSRTDRPIFWELDKETVDELLYLIDRYMEKHQSKFFFWKRYTGDQYVEKLKNNFR